MVRMALQESFLRRGSVAMGTLLKCTQSNNGGAIKQPDSLVTNTSLHGSEGGERRPVGEPILLSLDFKVFNHFFT